MTVDLSYAIGLAPEEAIAYFKAKGYAFSWNWYEIWEKAHAKAFTVAKAMKLDILQGIRNALLKAMESGLSLSTFQNDLQPLLEKLGWWGKTEDGVQLGSAHRLETIYRTNIQSAYSAGRWETQIENADDRPYLQYVAVLDSRTRPAHGALHGKVFEITDKFWDTHSPPLGFSCRCRTRALTAKQVKDRGLDVETGNKNMVWEDRQVSSSSEIMRPVAGYKDPYSGKTVFTDLGWSNNPGKDAWEIDRSKYDPEIRKLIKK